jgi:replication factor A3
MEKPTPMINSAMLAQHAGQTVRIVGKVQKLTGQTLLIQTSDMGNVEVALNPDSEISGSTFVEITGKVSEGGSGLDGHLVREFTTVDCGENVGMYNRRADGAKKKDGLLIPRCVCRYGACGEDRSALEQVPQPLLRLDLA